MSNTDHQHTAAVEQAALWLSEQNPPPRPIVPALKERFGLTALQATEAAALSHDFRMNRRAAE